MKYFIKNVYVNLKEQNQTWHYDIWSVVQTLEDYWKCQVSDVTQVILKQSLF